LPHPQAPAFAHVNYKAQHLFFERDFKAGKISLKSTLNINLSGKLSLIINGYVGQ